MDDDLLENIPEDIRETVELDATVPFRKILEKEGITKVELAKLLKKELKATQTKSFQYKGEVIESIPKIAWEIRQRARRDALSYHGIHVKQYVEGKLEGLTPMARAAMRANEDRLNGKQVEQIPVPEEVKHILQEER
jgi:hypothetical protein